MSTPSSSAAICARPVSIPWPSEPTPARTTTVPSKHASTDASSNGPIPPSSTIAATPIPIAVTLRGPGLALRLQLREIRSLEHLLEGGREVATARTRSAAHQARGRTRTASDPPVRDCAGASRPGSRPSSPARTSSMRSRTNAASVIPGPAVRADGRPVREHRVRGHRERVPGVRPGQMRAGKDRRQDAVRPRVRAEVAPQSVLEGERACRPGAPRRRSRAPAPGSGSWRRDAPRDPRSTSRHDRA